MIKIRILNDQEIPKALLHNRYNINSSRSLLLDLSLRPHPAKDKTKWPKNKNKTTCSNITSKTSLKSPLRGILLWMINQIRIARYLSLLRMEEKWMLQTEWALASFSKPINLSNRCLQLVLLRRGICHCNIVRLWRINYLQWGGHWTFLSERVNNIPSLDLPVNIQV